MEAIGPSLVIVANDSAADVRPLPEVRRRADTMRLEMVVVLNRHAKTIENLESGGGQGSEIGVRIGEIIGFRKRRVRVGIQEDVRDVHQICAAKGSPGVMKAHIGDARILQFRQFAIVDDGGVVDAVKRLDSAFPSREVYLHHQRISRLFCPCAVPAVPALARFTEDTRRVRRGIEGACGRNPDLLHMRVAQQRGRRIAMARGDIVVA